MESMSGKKYRLTLTEEQAKIVSRACEFYARVGYGQYMEIVYDFLSPRDEDFIERRDEAERLLFKAREQIYPDLVRIRCASYGVGFDKRMDKAYDVHQVLRHALGYPREPWNLDGSRFAECEVVDDGT